VGFISSPWVHDKDTQGMIVEAAGRLFPAARPLLPSGIPWTRHGRTHHPLRAPDPSSVIRIGSRGPANRDHGTCPRSELSSGTVSR
jgi:hypothetical protein